VFSVCSETTEAIAILHLLEVDELLTKYRYSTYIGYGILYINFMLAVPVGACLRDSMYWWTGIA